MAGMLDVQAALERAGIPGYRAAYRDGDGNGRLPEVYAAWALKTEPWDFCDDRAITLLHQLELNLVSAYDPMEPLQAVMDELAGEGFMLAGCQDGYDEAADLYVIETTWRGVEQLGD